MAICKAMCNGASGRYDIICLFTSSFGRLARRFKINRAIHEALYGDTRGDM